MKSMTLLKSRLLITLFFVFLIPFGVWAQGKTITGNVSDEKGNSLPGVTVVVKGTNVGITTDIDGKYTLNVAKETSLLVFSFIGMVSQEIPVAGKTSINVVMKEDIIGLDEVVAVGYGTQKKSELTSAITSVKADDFVKGAVKDAGQLLQGKIAGLSVSTPNGDPTESAEIMLRGVNTMKGDKSPLVIIDGIPGDLKTVAPQDIESIDVLKDGSAAAIYGTRGTNGVILITTRQGKKNSPITVDYSGYVSTQQYARKASFYTAEDYYSMPELQGKVTEFEASTDWLSEISRTPISHNHDLSMKGGNETTSFIGSVNYQNNQGMILKSDFEKYTARLEFKHTAFNGLLDLSLGLLSGNSTSDAVDQNFAYRQSLIYNPTAPVYLADGSYYEQTGIQDYCNPVALLLESDGTTKETYNRYYGSITLKPIEGLNAKLMYSKNSWSSKYGYFETKNHISTKRDGKNGLAKAGSENSFDNLLEFTVDYRKSINGHNFNVLGGYSYQDHEWERMYMENYGFLTDYFSYNKMQVGEALALGKATMETEKKTDKLIGFFGRLNYNYKEKYLITVSARHEGSSKFGKDRKWGTFPAVQLGWKINKEGFMDGLSFVNELKLRAGYSITGSEPTDPYKSLILLDVDDKTYVYYNGKWIQTIKPVNNENTDFGWEEKREMNAGLDFSLFKGRLNGNIDLYSRKVTGMLWDYSVPVPPNFYSTTLANVGEMENKGIEVGIQGIPVKTKDFSWMTNVNYSANKNKLISLTNDMYTMTNDYIDQGYTGDPIQQSTHRIYIGQELGTFFGYKTVDITTVGDEWGTVEGGEGVWVIETPAGERKLISKASVDDKQIIGNGLPKFYIDWNNTISYKNFDLSVTMRGAFGYQILNYQRMFYENQNATASNQMKSTYDLVYGKAVLNYSQDYVSYYLEEGDYWKIDNITLGYTLMPKDQKVFRSFRVYASMLNALTFTKYKGIDPEVSRFGDTGLNPGCDSRDKFPTTHTYTLGVNITF
jgi:TonB-dependent starch-binding outer membrane protein SusC